MIRLVEERGRHEPTEIRRIALGRLRVARQLRPVDYRFVRLLARQRAHPPILVDHEWRVVLDGVHRILAARLRQDTTIAARCVAPREDLFLAAVASNLADGRPLRIEIRKEAARRLLAWSPDWSDRRIAGATSLATGTVASLRRVEQGRHDGWRRGADGRRRPTDQAATRLRIAHVLSDHPMASLREAARLAEASPATVRDVKLRLARGQDVLPDRLRVDAAVTGMVVDLRDMEPNAQTGSEGCRVEEAVIHSRDFPDIDVRARPD